MTEPQIFRSRIAVLGGTFDPVTQAHMMAVRHLLLDARPQAFDHVILVPTLQSPIKAAPCAQWEDRLVMAGIAVREAGFDPQKVRVSDVERLLGTDGPHFTLDVLRVLAAQHPTSRFVLVVGPDHERGAGWRGWAEIQQQFGVYVLPDFRVRSTTVREDIAAAERNGLISPAVAEYCREHGLYTKTERTQKVTA